MRADEPDTARFHAGHLVCRGPGVALSVAPGLNPLKAQALLAATMAHAQEYGLDHKSTSLLILMAEMEQDPTLVHCMMPPPVSLLGATRVPSLKPVSKYVHNEALVTIEETIDIMMHGNVLVSYHINGLIRCHCKLSQSPTLLLKLSGHEALNPSNTSVYPSIAFPLSSIAFQPLQSMITLARYRLASDMQVSTC